MRKIQETLPTYLFEENNKKIRDRDWIICGHVEKEYEDRYQRDHVWYHENHISDE